VIVLADLLDLPVERTARQLGIGVQAAKNRCTGRGGRWPR
jgi:hypothetical protein